MPWKLIGYLVLLGIILAFVGLNVSNTSDISLGFTKFTDVPVFLSLFAAFFLGVLVSLPIAVQTARRKTKVTTERRLLKSREREQKQQEKEQKRAEKDQKRRKNQADNQEGQ